MQVNKFRIGDIVTSNGSMDNPSVLNTNYKIVNMKQGNDDVLLDIVDEETGKRRNGYYQYRFVLVRVGKKGNYEQYNRNR